MTYDFIQRSNQKKRKFLVDYLGLKLNPSTSTPDKNGFTQERIPLETALDLSGAYKDYPQPRFCHHQHVQNMNKVENVEQSEPQSFLKKFIDLK